MTWAAVVAAWRRRHVEAVEVRRDGTLWPATRIAPRDEAEPTGVPCDKCGARACMHPRAEAGWR